MDSCQRSPSTRPKIMNGRHYHSLFNTLPFTLDIFNSLPCMTTIFPSTSLFSILVKSPLRVSARKLRALSLRSHMLRDRKLALLFTDIPTQHSHDGPAFCALDPLREVAGLLEQKYFRTNAGRRTDFRDRKSSDFSGENFRERNYCPRTAFSGSNSCSILSNQVFS